MATRPPPFTRQPTEPIEATPPTRRRVQAEVGDGADDTVVRVEDRRAPRTRRAGADAPVVLDRYRLHRRLGTGGFGTVWQARDERLERDVAVKLLPRERIVGGRFEREARAAARLTHPGIVTLYEAAVDDDGAYLVSELVRGATLGELLRAGRLSDRDIVQIGVALCDALAHAHAHGIVHRDVKPSNVLVPEHAATPAQLAKLTDFGVARIIGSDTLTRTGDVIGTMAYMAPEQAEGLEAGTPADLYSLALVLYEALTGVNPVQTGTGARRARRLGAYMPPIRRQRRDLPRELGCAIDLALRPRPRERGTVEELRAALEASLGELQDQPGVVEGAWPRRRASKRDAQAAAPAFEPSAAPPLEPVSPRFAPVSAPAPAPEDLDLAPTRTPIPWPDRALAAASAAGVAAWLTGSVLAPSVVNPVIAAAVAAVAVAALPRLGWLALIVTAAGALAVQGRSGATLVVLLAGLLPALLLFRHPARWPLGAIAPALGAVSLAGAWPALAGRAATVWQRAALGASGWVMLLGAELLGRTSLYVQLPHAVAPRSSWATSLSGALDHALVPLASSGALFGALVWAAAAVVLPWVTVIRPLPVTIVLVVIWTAATASATSTVLHAAHAAATVKPEAAALGAVAAGIIAISPPLLAAAAPWRRSERTRVA